MIERALVAAARAQVRAPRLVVLALLALTAGAIVALPFRIDPDVASLLPRGDVELELLREMQSSSDAARTMWLVVRGERLEERMAELAAALEASPYLAEVAATKLALGGELAERARDAPLHFLPESALDALEARLSPEGRRAALAESKRMLVEDPVLGREIVARDPLGLRWILEEAARAASPGNLDPASPYLIVAGGSAALVRIRGEREPFDVEFSRALVADVIGRSAGFEVERIGGYEIARTDAQRIRGDLESSLYWGIPMLFAFLALSTRSLYLPLAFHVPVALATVWALGYGGLLLGPLTPLAVSAAATLMGMGMDFAVHYASRYASERRASAHAEAVERAHRGTGRAMFYGMATSVVAFLTIGLGAFRSLESFGILLSLGLIAAWGAALAVLPLMLARARPAALLRPPGATWRWAARFVRTRAARAAALAIVLVSALGWAAVLARGITFDADPDHLRPADQRLGPRLAALGRLLGFSPLGVIALVPESVPVEELARAADALASAGVVAFSSGPHRTMPGSERAERVARFAQRTEGWVDGTLADMQALGLRPGAFRPALEEWAQRLGAAPPDEAADERVAWHGTSYRRATFHAPAVATSRAERLAFRDALARALPAGALLVDPNGLADRIGPLLESDFRQSTAWSALAVALLTWLGVRSLRATAIALAPVLAALGVMLGLASLLGWALHPGNFIAVPLILGLGVDYGIHIVLRAREGDADVVLETGPPIWRTSATTCLGFGSLVSAASPALSSLGVHTLLGMLASFLASMILVPVLWEKGSWRSAPSASVS